MYAVANTPTHKTLYLQAGRAAPVCAHNSAIAGHQVNVDQLAIEEETVQVAFSIQCSPELNVQTAPARSWRRSTGLWRLRRRRSQQSCHANLLGARPVHCSS